MCNPLQNMAENIASQNAQFDGKMGFLAFWGMGKSIKMLKNLIFTIHYNDYNI